MDAIEPGPVETLTERDIAAGLALSDQAGWNQTAEDWALFLARGTVLGRRAPAGDVIATAAVLPGGTTGWLSLVLTARAWRRRGLAAGLMRHCLQICERRHLEPWLDATPAGAQVYRPLGFVTVAGFTRLRRPANANTRAMPREPGDALDALVALDRRALGFDRGALLRDHARRSGSVVYGDARAACLVRAGRRARHIGPLHATSVAAALDLAGRVLDAEPGELICDLSDNHAALLDLLAARGFVAERSFERMRRGGGVAVGAPELLMASAGPEYG